MRVRDVIEWVILGAIWGGSFLFTKVAVPEFGAYAVVAVRLAVAAAVLAVPVFVRREWPHVRAKWKTLLVLGVINSAIPFTLFAWAMQPRLADDGTMKSFPAGDSSVLNATAPLFAAVLGFVFLREKVALRQGVGLVIGFVGVVVMLVWDKLKPDGNRETVHDGNGWAVLACLTAAFLYGVAAHIINRRLKGVPPVAVSATSLFFAAVALMPVAVFNLPSKVPSGEAWASAVALGVVCTAVAFLMYFRLLKNIGPTRAMAVTYVIPVFGILWGCLFLKETMSESTIVGGAIIVAGVVLVKWPEKKKAEVTPTKRTDLAETESRPPLPVGERSPHRA